jgi:hypothetical protein
MPNNFILPILFKIFIVFLLFSSFLVCLDYFLFYLRTCKFLKEKTTWCGELLSNKVLSYNFYEVILFGRILCYLYLLYLSCVDYIYIRYSLHYKLEN